jgi:tetratricopeptide (TPR) repeat protein
MDSLISDLGLEGLYPLSLYATGRVQETEGDCIQAIRLYEDALRLDPWQVETEIHLGRCLTALSRSQEAVERLEQTLRVYPQSAAVHQQIATAYLDLEDTTAARQHLDTALQIWKDADATYAPAQRVKATRSPS